MLIYPTINPVAVKLGPLAVHWYGLMYAVGFLSAWRLALVRAHQRQDWTKEQVADLIFYGALGVIIGGRVGSMLFYNFADFLSRPWTLFEIWQGGMAFHGGLLGVLMAMYLYKLKIKKPYMDIIDFIAPLVPLGLAAGRIGNFINSELWGRVTTVPWGMVYPNGGLLPRHPSQIYEFFLEGLLLFTILWLYSSKPRPRMAVAGLFGLLYGLFRIIGECFRQPDQSAGFIAFGWLTEGQLLSIPLVMAGLILLIRAYKRTAATLR